MSQNAKQQLALAERILMQQFQSQPFHNLYHLLKVVPINPAYGGTCSDKTKSYLGALEKAGIEGCLHSARIGGKEIHRLVRVVIGNHTYFADVGNGWPAIKLFPADRPVEYNCFGMRYRSEIDHQVMNIFLLKKGIEKLQMQLDLKPKCPVEIQQCIDNRFAADNYYPFSNSLRFSMIVDDRFLFIRDAVLSIYSKKNYEEVPNINQNNIALLVEQYFRFDINAILSGKPLPNPAKILQ
ncbi:hypothetical protein WG68_04515 [Arsukibacterium ikkense]|uniref:Uncharacterized protein n=1 Tax=Arsukibacterium ikkense TaxID=336831 RepID=A0A0M2VAA6_9GAMM|nr:hypothetical protein [Arsukibacterium ikkense]KKO46570.1 hypothetical protein WG68_04515 [Arsukibacterium ikkense]